MIKVDRAGFDRLRKALAEMSDSSVEVGWWNDSAADGRLTMPQLAQILHDGAVLKGGQPFLIFGDGRIAFLSRKSVMGRRILESRAKGSSGAASSATGNISAAAGGKAKKAGADDIVATGVTKPSLIPARPFLTVTAAAKSRQWFAEAFRCIKACLAGKLAWKNALDLIGQAIRADIYEQMGIAGNFAPNTPMTQARKKDGPKNTPLIDTNGLREALDYTVRRK